MSYVNASIDRFRLEKRSNKILDAEEDALLAEQPPTSFPTPAYPMFHHGKAGGKRNGKKQGLRKHKPPPLPSDYLSTTATGMPYSEPK